MNHCSVHKFGNTVAGWMRNLASSRKSVEVAEGVRARPPLLPLQNGVKRTMAVSLYTRRSLSPSPLPSPRPGEGGDLSLRADLRDQAPALKHSPPRKARP